MSDRPKTVDEFRKKWNVHENNQISIGPGWVPIVDALMTRMAEMGVEYHSAFECKQKFGELRIYFITKDKPFWTNELDNLVDLACFEAKETCEHCGQFGQLQERESWLGVLCPGCVNKGHNGRVPRY